MTIQLTELMRAAGPALDTFPGLPGAGSRFTFTFGTREEARSFRSEYEGTEVEMPWGTQTLDMGRIKQEDGKFILIFDEDLKSKSLIMDLLYEMPYGYTKGYIKRKMENAGRNFPEEHVGEILEDMVAEGLLIHNPCHKDGDFDMEGLVYVIPEFLRNKQCS